jgi:hypothetical protein
MPEARNHQRRSSGSIAEHSSTAPRAPRRLATTYGVRLLFDARARTRLVLLSAAMAAFAYLLAAVLQLLTLRGTNLQFDFAQFYAAGAALNRGDDPYRPFLDACPGVHWCLGGYIYPPLLAELVRPLAALSLTSALRLWLLVSQACLVASTVVAARTLHGQAPPAALGLLLVAAVAFLPLHYSLYFGQVGLVLLALLTVTVCDLMRDRGMGGGGLAAGFAAVLRVSPVLVLPALWRRPRALLVAVASALALLGGLALLSPYTAEYFTAVLPRIGASTGILDNQAPQGLLLRAASLWGLPAPAGPAVTALIGLVFLAPTAWLGLRRDGELPWRGAAAAAFVAAMPLVSSLTWHHHLVIELLVYVALAPALALPSMGAARSLAVVSYPLLWVDRHFTDALAGALGLAQPTGWRIAPFLLVTGLNLLGMLCLWAAALSALRGLSQRPDAAGR